MSSALRPTRLLSGALVALAVSLLIGAFGLALSIRGSTEELTHSVEQQQGMVEANVRTLAQTQRELLQLQLYIAGVGDLSDEQFELRMGLVSSRVDESTRDYQLKTLGDQSLLDRAKVLREQWNSQLMPRIVAWHEARPRSSVVGTELFGQVARLEQQYNELVSRAEQNRKKIGAQALAATEQMVQSSSRLVYLVLASFLGASVFAAIGGLVLRRINHERNRTNDELRALNGELRSYQHIVEATNSMVVLTDRSGAIAWGNEAFERTLGMSSAQIQGRDAMSLLAGPDTDEQALVDLARRAVLGKPGTGEMAAYLPGGRHVWLHIAVSQVNDPSGAAVGYVIVLTDMTERHEAERLLDRARIEAESAATEKSAFLSTMSHEIRTPLNAILGMSELLLLSDLDDHQAQLLRTSRASGEHLLSLLNDILDLSAIEAGRTQTEQVVFGMEEALGSVFDMSVSRAAVKGVRLERDIAPDVPKNVRGDLLHVRQILLNLVGNAVKFTPSGTVRLAVSTVEQARREGRVEGRVVVRFVVSDTGIGIPDDRVEQLFRPFVQGDASTTRRYGGTGLGLVISKHLAEQMGGSIELRSTEGVGTSVEVRLPFTVEAPSGSPGQRLDAVAVPDLRVLVAEDDPVNQTVITLMLKKLQLTPEVVGDGVQAVNETARNPYDVVLMDMQMPNLDGVGAQTQIRVRDAERAPYICAVTADALTGDRDRLMAAGMDDYLPKPISLESLREMLLRAAARRGGHASSGGVAVTPSARPAKLPPGDAPLIEYEI